MTKYYVNKAGLITLISGISDSIKNHTNGEITFSEGNLNNPNNLVTTRAVVTYVDSGDSEIVQKIDQVKRTVDNLPNESISITDINNLF
jgi:hypothetical protein